MKIADRRLQIQDHLQSKIFNLKCGYAAFSTLPDRRQPVHTKMRLTVPFKLARTRWRFGCQRRLVLLLAWLTLCPTDECLPQIVQLLAMVRSC